MAHTAQLKLEGRDYKLLECEYEFIQPIKENGQPAGRPAGGLIHFTMEAPDDDTLVFHDWMQNATEHRNGQIIFSVIDEAKPTTKTLHFKHAYCIRLCEYFSNGHSNPQEHRDSQMLTKITISAAEIAFGEKGSIVFKNDHK